MATLNSKAATGARRDHACVSSLHVVHCPAHFRARCGTSIPGSADELIKRLAPFDNFAVIVNIDASLGTAI